MKCFTEVSFFRRHQLSINLGPYAPRHESNHPNMNNAELAPIEIDPRDTQLLDRIGRLRVTAWETVFPKLRDELDCWLDPFEITARHWCVFDSGQIVAAARIGVHQQLEDVPNAEVYAGVFTEPLPAPIASINITHPNYRGRGISGKLDAVRIKAAEEMGCGCCVAFTTASRDARSNQLREIGFVDVAGVVVSAALDSTHTVPARVLLRIFENSKSGKQTV